MYRIETHSEKTEPFRNLFQNESEKRFMSRLMKNGQKLNQINLIQSEASIRINTNQVFNLNHPYLRFIQIKNSD